MGGVAQMVERSLSMREVPGSIPGASKFIFLSPFVHVQEQKKLAASSGNRTRAARVAGEHSTTEPTMLAEIGGPYVQMLFCQTSSCGRVVKATDSKSVSLWERRFESYQLRQHVFCMDCITGMTQ